MFDREDFQGVNAAYVLELHEKYQRDPHAVDPATREFFEGWRPEGFGETRACAQELPRAQAR